MIRLGNSLTVLQEFADDSIDSLVTDPPAGISFMGKDWDRAKEFISRMGEIYMQCLRVLKPGAHGLVWAIPRTSHWTATALEQAGFEIRDVVTHIFGSGFPKSLNIGKTISEWAGWGTALKPASEHWILVRKPLGESTVAKNMLKWGTGGLNIDASRIAGPIPSVPNPKFNTTGSIYNMKTREGRNGQMSRVEGRFPANLVLSHNEDCDEACTEGCAVKALDEMSGVLKSGSGQKSKNRKSPCHEGGFKPDEKNFSPSQGCASRFFYCAKASRRDRNEGLEGMPVKQATGGGGGIGNYLIDVNSASGKYGSEKAPAQNHHPTVKSTKLMEYLIRLITPPQGIVLDPFMGSGSTGVAAKRLGFGFIGIEKDSEYFEIATQRILSSSFK